VLTILAPNPDWFILVFVLRGLSFGGGFLSLLFILEFNTTSTRPTYIGLNNTIVGIVSAVAPLVGGLLATLSGYQGLFYAALVFSLIGLVLLHFTVRDPRHAETQKISIND
jgi:MFS family permease